MEKLLNYRLGEFTRNMKKRIMKFLKMIFIILLLMWVLIDFTSSSYAAKKKTSKEATDIDLKATSIQAVEETLVTWSRKFLKKNKSKIEYSKVTDQLENTYMTRRQS